MILIGMFDSPFVRRVAVSMNVPSAGRRRLISAPPTRGLGVRPRCSRPRNALQCRHDHSASPE